MRLTLYTRRDCHLCDEMKAVVRAVGADLPFELEEIDVDRSRELKKRYGLDVPVLEVDGEELARHRVTAGALREALLKRQAGRHGA
jgi:glutaredoxin